MADDQGWEETGYNGHPALQTPSLDAMASAGLRLDRFYSAAPNCGPTRGSIMTGRNANRFGLFGPNWAMRPEEITLGELFRDAGYATGHFGKWHLGPVKAGAANNPGGSGFQTWLSHDNFFEMNPVFSRNGEPPEQHPGESSAIVVRAAEAFIERSLEEERPFFAVVWFGSPHAPYLALQEDQQRYTAIEDETLQNRYAEITAMDRAIGQLRGALRRLGVADETLFWYCSDNGVPGNHRLEPRLRSGKGSLYEGGLRVPGIIEWPSRIAAGSRSSLPCVTSDILPTLCDLLELPLPERPLDGISLVATLSGQPQQRTSPIAFWKYAGKNEQQHGRWLDHASQQGTTPTVRNPGINFLNFKHPVALTAPYRGQAAIVDGPFKLITGLKHGAELYQLEQDPLETDNVSAEFPQTVAQLQRSLETWQASVERSLTGADYLPVK